MSEVTDESVGPRSEFLQVNGLKLHYLEWGPADAPPVVLLHGGLDNALGWNRIAAGLAGRRRVLALDLRGHGDSDWSAGGDYDAHNYLADIAMFTKAVARWPITLVGHSMGGRLGLQFAGAVPEAVDSLVAIEGVANPAAAEVDDLDPRMREWLQARADRQAGSHAIQLGAWLRGRAAMAAQPPRVHAELGPLIERQIMDRKKRLSSDQARDFVESNTRPAPGGWTWKFDPLTRWQTQNEPVTSHQDYWAAITAPVLHVFGRESWAYPPASEDLAAFRSAQVAVLPDAGHWAHLNQPEAVLDAIEEFLG
jgi:pimeloyl-ACP methyl ester carboxylesterase